MKYTVACPCLRRTMPKRIKLLSPSSKIWVCMDCNGKGTLTPKQQKLAAINDEVGKLKLTAAFPQRREE